MRPSRPGAPTLRAGVPGGRHEGARRRTLRNPAVAASERVGPGLPARRFVGSLARRPATPALRRKEAQTATDGGAVHVQGGTDGDRRRGRARARGRRRRPTTGPCTCKGALTATDDGAVHVQGGADGGRQSLRSPPNPQTGGRRASGLPPPGSRAAPNGQVRSRRLGDRAASVATRRESTAQASRPRRGREAQRCARRQPERQPSCSRSRRPGTKAETNRPSGKRAPGTANLRERRGAGRLASRHPRSHGARCR